MSYWKIGSLVALRRITRTLLLSLVLVAPSTASANAAVREGAVGDAQDIGNASFDPNACYVPDLARLAVAYNDTAGTIRATWTYYTDLAHYCSSSASLDGFELTSNGGSTPTPPASISANLWRNHDTSWSVMSSLDIDGIDSSLSGSGSISSDGHSVTVEFSHAALAARDWRYVSPRHAGWDEYESFWFEGYKPLVNPVPVDGAPNSGATGGDRDTGEKPASGAPVKPVGPVGVTVNDGAQYTNDARVQLDVVWPAGTRTLWASNDGGFKAAQEIPVATTVPWRLATAGPERLPKTVYVRFGSSTQTFTDDIILDETSPSVASATLVRDTGSAAMAARKRTYRVRTRASDRTSGVAQAQLATNKRSPNKWRRFRPLTTVAAASRPRFVRVRDRAGNVSRWRSIR